MDLYGRSLAHTALIVDGWRRSELRDRDGAHTVWGASAPPNGGGGPSWAGVSRRGGEVLANAEIENNLCAWLRGRSPKRLRRSSQALRADIRLTLCRRRRRAPKTHFLPAGNSQFNL